MWDDWAGPPRHRRPRRHGAVRPHRHAHLPHARQQHRSHRARSGTKSASPTRSSTRRQSQPAVAGPRRRRLLPAEARSTIRRSPTTPERADRDLRARSPASSTTRCLSAHNLAYAARQHGAEFRFHQEVVGIEQAGGRVPGVTLADGSDDRTPRWSSTSAARTRASSTAWPASPTACASATARCARRCSPSTAPDGSPPEDGVPAWPTSTSASTSARRSAAPWLLGGTEPECDELHWVDDPDQFNDVPHGRAVRGRR